MIVKIHTQGWKGSSPIKPGEEPGALFAGLLELDGEIYDRVNDIKVNFSEDFATVDVTLIPSDVEVVTHTKESWETVCDRATARENARTAIRRSDGRTIAIYVSPKEEEQ